MEDLSKHWSEDAYWVDALEAYQEERIRGRSRIVLDLDAIEAEIHADSGPAYRLLRAMESVWTMEGMDGMRGAPRLVLALLERLDELSRDRPRSP